MDTDSFYLAISGYSLDESVKPGIRQAYEVDKKNWLATEKFTERAPGLFKPEFVGTRGVWLTAKCCIVKDQNKIGEDKYSCKGVSKKHNDLYFGRYKDVLDVFQNTGIDIELEGGVIDKAKNVGFRVFAEGIVTYKQNKLGLSAYHDKRYMLTDGIHTRSLEF